MSVKGMTRIIELDVADSISDTLSENTVYMPLTGHGSEVPYGLRGLFVILMRVFGHGLGLWVLRLGWMAVVTPLAVAAAWLVYLQAGGLENLLRLEMAERKLGTVGRVETNLMKGLRAEDIELSATPAELTENLRWLQQASIQMLQLDWNIAEGNIKRVKIGGRRKSGASGGDRSMVSVDLPNLLSWLKKRKKREESRCVYEMDGVDIILSYTSIDKQPAELSFYDVSYREYPGAPQPVRTFSVGGIGSRTGGSISVNVSSNGILRVEIRRLDMSVPALSDFLDARFAGKGGHWWSGFLDAPPEGLLDAEFDIVGLPYSDLASGNFRCDRFSARVTVTDPDISTNGYRLTQDRARLAGASMLSPAFRKLLSRLEPAAVRLEIEVRGDEVRALLKREGQWPLHLLAPAGKGKPFADLEITGLDFSGKIETSRGCGECSPAEALFGAPRTLKELNLVSSVKFAGVPLSIRLRGNRRAGGEYRLGMELLSEISGERNAVEPAGWRVAVELRTAGTEGKQVGRSAVTVGGYSKEAEIGNDFRVTAGYSVKFTWDDDPVSRVVRSGGLGELPGVLRRWAHTGRAYKESIAAAAEPDLLQQRLDAWRRKNSLPPRRLTAAERFLAAYFDGSLKFGGFEVSRAEIRYGPDNETGYILDDLNIKGDIKLHHGDSVSRRGLPRLAGDVLQPTPVLYASVTSGEMKHLKRVTPLTPEELEIEIRFFAPSMYPPSAPDSAAELLRKEMLALIKSRGRLRGAPEPVGIVAIVKGRHPSPWQVRAELPADYVLPLPDSIKLPLDPASVDAYYAALDDVSKTRRFFVSVVDLPARLAPDLNRLLPKARFRERDPLNFTFLRRRFLASDSSLIDVEDITARVGPISVEDPTLGLDIRGFDLEVSDRRIGIKTKKATGR